MMACAITNLPIKQNDEVFAILMFQSQTSDGSSTIWYATPIIFKAKYDGYGGVTDIHESYERMIPFFKEYLENHTTTARFSGEGDLTEQFVEVINKRHLLNNGYHRANNTKYNSAMAFISGSVLENFCMEYRYCNMTYPEICQQFFDLIQHGTSIVDKGFGAQCRTNGVIGNMYYDICRESVPDMGNLFSFYGQFICTYKNKEDLKYYTFKEKEPELVYNSVVNMTTTWLVQRYLRTLNRGLCASKSSGQVFDKKPFDFFDSLVQNRINELLEED